MYCVFFFRFFSITGYYKLIGYSSLCYAVGPWYLSILTHFAFYLIIDPGHGSTICKLCNVYDARRREGPERSPQTLADWVSKCSQDP